jgi:muramoyltetrapeptide carboxypeptidase
MISPPFLKPGSRVAIAATARKISREELNPAVLLLRERGFEVLIPEGLFAQEHQFAGSDAHRLTIFQQLLDDETLEAIFIARGGYGTLRLVDAINWEGYGRHPKWVVGYSDITVLHCHLLAQAGSESFHATMPINFGLNSNATQTLFNALMGADIDYRLHAHPLNRNGSARGLLAGGNLSLLYALNGSRSVPDLRGKILFIEDLDEYLYHIDRMILSLKRAGWFSQLAAVVVGGMSDMRDNTIPFGSGAEEIIHHHLSEYDFPLCFHFPAGHIAENLPIIMGREAQLKVTEHQVSFFQHGRA